MTLAVTSQSPLPSARFLTDRVRDDFRSAEDLDFAALVVNGNQQRDQRQTSEISGFQPELSMPGPAIVKLAEFPDNIGALVTDTMVARSGLLEFQEVPETFLESSMFESRATAASEPMRADLHNQSPVQQLVRVEGAHQPTAPVVQGPTRLTLFSRSSDALSVSAKLTTSVSNPYISQRSTLLENKPSASSDQHAQNEVADLNWRDTVTATNGRMSAPMRQWQWSPLHIALSVIRGQIEASFRIPGLEGEDVERLFSVLEELSRDSDLPVGTVQMNGRALAKRVSDRRRFGDAG